MANEVLDASQLAALGAVVLHSGKLENKLNLIIQDFTKLDGDELAMLGRGSMLHAKLEIVEKLGEKKFRSKRRRQELKTILSSLKSRNKERTTVVHGNWYQFPGGPTKQLMHLGSNSKSAPEAIHKGGAPFKASNLTKLAAQIEIATEDLWQLFMTARAVPAYRRKERRKKKQQQVKAAMEKLKADIGGLGESVKITVGALQKQRDEYAQKLVEVSRQFAEKNGKPQE